MEPADPGAQTPPTPPEATEPRTPRGASATERPPDNLPYQLTSFVGREREVAEAKRLLDETRLLTLTGPGGCGKTRLALAVAAGVSEGYEAGVRWVGLASLSDPTLVPQAVAQALEVSEQPDAPLTDTLADSLRQRRLLLVLDNCEHLVEACARFAQTMLVSCPHLRILATSRETLNAAGEIAWSVPPLSLPELRRPPDAEVLPSYESVRLFVERARAAKISFALDEGNAMAVARVCNRLDGIPLAIELAAARTKVLSVEQISERLEDSLRLLAGGDRTAPARQQTLRGALDWSYQLLAEQERKLYGRLSAFAGGWTLEAAEAVGPGDGIEEEDVLDLLCGLVDKSMVVAEVGTEDALRYRMLEPVRQYGQERLEESGEAARTSRRHAEFYLAWMEEIEPELKGPRQVELMDQLEEDHDNLRAAIRWSLEQGETEIALRLTASTAHFRYPRGYLAEGRRQLEAALAGTPGPPAARAKALTELGWFVLEQSDYGQARGLLEASLLLYRELDDKYGVAHALECLSVAETRLGDYGRAAKLQEESLALYGELDHKWGIAVSLGNLGVVAQLQGEYERAATLHLESLALLRVQGDSLEMGFELSSLAQVFLAQGQLERSAMLLEESQTLLRQLGTKLTLAETLRIYGETVSRQGDGTRAASIYKEGLVLAVEVGSKTVVAGCLEGLAEVTLAQGQPARTARLLGAAEALREAIGSRSSHFDRSQTGYEGTVAAARSRLGEAAWEAACTEGRRMTSDAAIAYALETSSPTPPSKGDKISLSVRELEILRLVAGGLTDPQVAERLYLSPRTVGQHLRSIYRKLGVPSRAAAAKEAVERSLI